MKFTIYDLPAFAALRRGRRFTSRSPCIESGAEATALQTLTRLPGILEIREASGVRPVYRRFVPG
jgi:hypothetical protein